MIGIYDDAGTRLASVYNGLTLNNPADPADDVLEINSVITLDTFDAIRDARPDQDGIELYASRRMLKVVRIDGVVRAPTLARFFDRSRDLARAFDPAKLSSEFNPAADLFAPEGTAKYLFDVPTLDTGTFADGLAESFLWARARAINVPPVSMYTGKAGFFSLELEVPDARRHNQTQRTLVGAGTAANSGDYRAFPIITIAMAGAGASNYQLINNPTTIAIAPTTTLTLNLSGTIGGDTIVVDSARKRILKNGVETPSLWVSGDYPVLWPGDNAVSYSNATNATSTMAWYWAYLL